MGLTDAFGLPIAIDATSASPHEITLVDNTLDACFLENVPEKVIGDRAYDSDKLDERLAEERGVEMQNFRRLVVRYEYHLKNFLAMIQLGCIVILLRRVLG